MKNFDGEAIIEIDKSYKNYHISGDLLYKFQNSRDLLIIPKALELDIIRFMRKNIEQRTEERIRQEYFICDLRNKIERHIASYIPTHIYLYTLPVIYMYINESQVSKKDIYILKPDVPLHITPII